VIHFSLAEMAAICSMLAWPVITLFVALVGLVGLRKRARQRRAWRVTMIIAAVALAGDTILASPMIGWFIGEYATRWQIEHYTYRLDAPRMLDGTLFPAGSEIKLSIDAAHRLESGTLPVRTKVLGLELIGEFSVGLTNDRRAYIRWGRLASAATINTVPCGPGPLWRDDYDNAVHCTLARDMPTAGIVLSAGTSVEIWMDPSGGAPRINEATLAQSARLSGLSCSAGPVNYTSYRIGCVLDGDQKVKDIPLAGGRRAALRFASSGGSVLEDGTLAAPLQVLGVTLPAGTQVMQVGPYGAAELRAGPIAANDSLDFILPEEADLALHGATLKGSLRLEFRGGVLEVSASSGAGGTLAFGGRHRRVGWYDGEHGWRFDDD
jgi:hypothetical protein